MLALNFLKQMILNAFSNGVAIIISGYNNDTGEERTPELLETLLRRFASWSPVAFNAEGFWEGTAENSIVLVLQSAGSAGNMHPFTAKVITDEVRAICEGYNQYAALLAYNGEFHNIVNPLKSDERDSVIGNAISENIEGAQGWTSVVFPEIITEFGQPHTFFSFTITQKEVAEKAAA